MDVLPNAEEAALQAAAEAFLAAECPPALVRAAEQATPRWSPELWRQVTELGWQRLCLPEDAGGEALPLDCLGLLFEALGRHLAPIPLHGTMVGALVLARHGSAQQRALLQGVATGERILALALQEACGRWSPEAVRLTGRREGEHLVLDGHKAFVDGFRQASHMLLAFRMAPGGALSVALVETASAGLGVTDLITTAKDSSAALDFAGVRVPLSAVIGGLGGGAPVLRLAMDLAAAFMAAQMAGAARMATERAADYAKQRQAFGQPIGSFQAIQHLAADMLIAVDGAQLLAREAIWRLGAGLDATVEAAQAKAFANEKCLMACRSAQQIHGGIGFMADYDQQLWYRRVAAWAHRCGTAAEHRRVVAEALLDRQGPVRLDVPLGGAEKRAAGRA
jgi:alkylation response protein AidB-like acyl-CoA dehydrogenase